MHLYYQSYPEGQDLSDVEQIPVLIIPGLFGHTGNWRSFARSLSDAAPVIVVDQRNHGRSPHHDTHTYSDMVDDLLDFMDFLGLEKVVLCGHSMGGKVAMLFALLHPERVAQLIVMDIAPKNYPHSHAPFLEALMEIDIGTLSSRSEADKALKAAIPDTGTRLFLLQSLIGRAGAYQWRLNLPVLHQAMEHIVDFPDALVATKRFSSPCCLIYGKQSTYIDAADVSIFGQWFDDFHAMAIDGAGHWLHVEAPEAVLAAVRNCLKKGNKSDD